MSGADGDTSYIVHTNLTGAYNCLELARATGARMVFLSTSRVYSMDALNGAALEETETRFDLAAVQPAAGISRDGISESAPTGGARTLYGTTKLAAELLIEEYRAAFGLSAVVDRCGVVGGPWQMGKVDQGVFTHWMLSHHFGLPLSYIGFGGAGKQVRDLLHVDDLAELVESQLLEPDHWDGRVLNVGGGREGSLSLLEATAACAAITGRSLALGSEPETRAGDVPVYISDCAALFAHTEWRPHRDPMTTLRDIAEWIGRDEGRIAASLGFDGAGSGR
jgi:CDP-paratose 2-epimerase